MGYMIGTLDVFLCRF